MEHLEQRWVVLACLFVTAVLLPGACMLVNIHMLHMLPVEVA
jgi:hypothetical protein